MAIDPGVTFSVVCPTFNSSTCVLNTLESVARQTYLPHEVIVSDDGSSDDTVVAVENFIAGHPDVKIKVIKNAHRGPGATRNAAIRAATGDWVCFLDSDDEWSVDKLQAVASVIQESPGINFVCHVLKHRRFDGSIGLLDYGHKRYNPAKPLPAQMYQCNLFLTSSVTCRKDMLIESGLFDESLLSAQDYELWLRMSARIKPAFMQQTLGSYYDRKGSITMTDPWQWWKNSMRIAHRYRDTTTLIKYGIRVSELTIAYGKRWLQLKSRGWG